MSDDEIFNNSPIGAMIFSLLQMQQEQDAHQQPELRIEAKETYEAVDEDDFKEILENGGAVVVTISGDDVDDVSDNYSIDDAVVFVPITAYRDEPGVIDKLNPNDKIAIVDDKEYESDLPSENYDAKLRQTEAYQEAIEMLSEQETESKLQGISSSIRRYQVTLEILSLQRELSAIKPMQPKYEIDEKIEAYKLALEDTLPGKE